MVYNIPLFCCIHFSAVAKLASNMCISSSDLPICSSQRQIGCFCWKILLLARLSWNIPELPQTRIVLRMVETFFMLMVDQNFNSSEVCLIMIFKLVFFSCSHLFSSLVILWGQNGNTSKHMHCTVLVVNIAYCFQWFLTLATYDDT